MNHILHLLILLLIADGFVIATGVFFCATSYRQFKFSAFVLGFGTADYSALLYSPASGYATEIAVLTGLFFYMAVLVVAKVARPAHATNPSLE